MSSTLRMAKRTSVTVSRKRKINLPPAQYSVDNNKQLK